MAMQTGIGFSRILFLAGAGYTGSVLMKNGKVSDIVGEVQSLLKRLDAPEDSSNADSGDAITAQVRRLAMEVRQLASARQITVLNGDSGQIGNITSLVVPAAAVGALGYGYMWWKGISFSDLMYVTKRNMSSAVSNLTKHLENVSEALAATKRHLTQRIENLDGKLDDQVEISKIIRNEVTDVRDDLSHIGIDLDELRRMVSGLDGKICSLEYKQDDTNLGIAYLCNVADGRKVKMPQRLQEQFKLSGRSHAYLTSSESPSLKGLKEIADSLALGNANKATTDGVMEDDIAKMDELPRELMRMASTKC
ncbi:uncharacterized protein LOC132299163 [Cornus florida]|uniref:uncharacterized protein LOC132299163 n=1 Tax=Cornus florida TaxID=4283 RepID=UPI00289FD1F5|nr:uncharacterized protein LOC132299163 [Cornus florida]